MPDYVQLIFPFPRTPNLSPIESGGIERMPTPLKNDVDVSG
jgi:hypothetical protein